ncbi:hypothetical protein [Ruminococcus flavefaciens]|uniref:hypothetical protein n=1 Tax=Ruminococcus flavefaciens TaxID=1265 RepID=UPI0018AD5CA9|nr:hypothetical protein [Ruminococcus flavefaciens]
MKNNAKALGITEKKKVAVNGISFTARSGEVFGLIGPNGAQARQLPCVCWLHFSLPTAATRSTMTSAP